MSQKENQPRLFPESNDEKIYKNLRNFLLPDGLYSLVQDILEGRRKESTLICCHSGCEICNDRIVECIRQIRSELENGR